MEPCPGAIELYLTHGVAVARQLLIGQPRSDKKINCHHHHNCSLGLLVLRDLGSWICTLRNTKPDKASSLGCRRPLLPGSRLGGVGAIMLCVILNGEMRYTNVMRRKDESPTYYGNAFHESQQFETSYVRNRGAIGL